jgi:hypothetical protein
VPSGRRGDDDDGGERERDQEPDEHVRETKRH